MGGLGHACVGGFVCVIDVGHVDSAGFVGACATSLHVVYSAVVLYVLPPPPSTLLFRLLNFGCVWVEFT